MKSLRSSRFRLIAVLLVFFAAVFLLPASRTGDSRLYLLAAAVPGVILLLLLLPSGLFSLDRPSLSAALVLCGFTILAPAAVQPDEALSQAIRCAASLSFLFLGAVFVQIIRPSFPVSIAVSACALGMISLPLWVPGLPFVLTSGGIALLLLASASFLSQRMRLPALCISLAGLFLLLSLQDLSSATVWGITCILLFWTVSGSTLWSGIALGTIVALFAGRFILFPFSADAPVKSMLPLLSEFPLFLPEADTSPGPAGESSVFFLLGEQYGLIFMLCALLLAVTLILRSASLALMSRTPFFAAVCFGCVLLFGLPLLWFLSSLAGFHPFSPGSLPFLTVSVPDLCSGFFLLGLLSGISSRTASDLKEDARLAMLAH